MFDLHPLDERHIPHINAVISAAVSNWPLAKRLQRLSLPLLCYDAEDIRHYNLTGCYLADFPNEPRSLVGIVAWDDQCVHGLYVKPTHQGKGIGRMLLAAAAQTIRGDAPPLTVRAHRMSVTFFEHIGIPRLRDPSDYPYTFLLNSNFLENETAVSKLSSLGRFFTDR